MGFSVDDVLRAETMLTENFESPKFMSVERGVGHARHPQPLASRITEAVANFRWKKNMKAWKGPLPKPRSPQFWQLGDVKVKDLRIQNNSGATKSLKDLCSVGASRIDGFVKEGERGNIGTIFTHRRPLGLPDARALLLTDRRVKVGSHPAFTPTNGLISLFTAGGLPRRLAAKSEAFSAIAQARRVPLPFRKHSFAEIVRLRHRLERENGLEKMAGNRGGFEREGRVSAGAYGPYRRDRGSVGSGRSWIGRESWPRRGGDSQEAHRGA